MVSAHGQFINEASQVQQGKKLSIAEMASAYTRFMDDSIKKPNKLLLENQKNLISTIEVNSEERDLEIHEDVSLRSGGEIEEVNEKKEVEDSIEQLKNEEKSTSLE